MIDTQYKPTPATEAEAAHLIGETISKLSRRLRRRWWWLPIPVQPRIEMFWLLLDARTRASVSDESLDWATKTIRTSGLEPIEIDRLLRAFQLAPGQQRRPNGSYSLREFACS